MKKPKIIFFDIDETLAVKETRWMPESVKPAIMELQKQGIMVAIASGRALFGFADYILDLQPDVLVSVNGQLATTSDGTVIHSHTFSEETKAAYVDWAIANGVAYASIGKEGMAVSTSNPMIEGAFDIVYGKAAVDPLFHQNRDVYQMYTFSQEQIEPTMPQSIKDEIECVRWHPVSCDIMPKGGSKASGIEKVLEHYNISREDSWAFGDGLNDIEMFQTVGFAIAMGNAVEELKQHADFVTENIEDHGVARALYELGITSRIYNESSK